MEISRYKKVFYGIAFFVVPIILFYLMEAFEHNAFKEVGQFAQVYNIYLFECIACLLFYITGSGKIALRIELVVFYIYGLVNHYVMAFRSTPFVPWDVFSIRTAASVAADYDFTPSGEVVWVSIGFLVIFIALGFLKFNLKSTLRSRIVSTIGIGAIIGMFLMVLWNDRVQLITGLYPFLFTPAHMTKVNGMAVTFVMNLEYVYVEKPDGYSVEKAREILKEYGDGETGPEEQTLLENQNVDYPNIIVIMNEAFSDLSVLGEFTTNKYYMPFVHRLQLGHENTITGSLEVSVCGGNTANSEFEFLTGHTMDYFPAGSIPYQQYISGELPSLASQLKALGYKTYGMHPFNASGWKRDTVYPWMGFDKTYFEDDFDNPYYIRDYVSDKTAYEKIIQLYEEKEKNTPLFVFEVTMQNHSGYTEKYENFSPDVHVKEIDDFELDQYLSLIRVSDEELEKLVEYFSGQEEKTVIVFFGDHQPNDVVANKILSLNGKYVLDLTVEESKMRYQVPYVIWANFDIKEGKNVDTDISFLAAEVMEITDMPMTAYQKLLVDVKQNPNSEEYLNKYQIVQYYYMFDYVNEK